MTFEHFVVSINLAGWRIGSLCQLYEGWYACLIDDEEFIHASSGATAVEALEYALAEPSKGRLYDSDRAALEAEEISEKIDLAALGLVKRKEPLNRRF